MLCFASSTSAQTVYGPMLAAVKLFATASLASRDVTAMAEAQRVKVFIGGQAPGGDWTPAAGALKTYSSHGRQIGSVEIEAHRQTGYPHVLISYAYDKDHSFFDRKLGYDPPHWLGDSGAFTAWTVGQKIDLDGLIEWCRWHVERKPDFVCITLDVIPGEAGGNNEPTRKEKERAIAESMANGDAMRAAGLKIMEVYHVFEPLSQLEVLLERRQPGEILGLGGMVGRSSTVKRQFADGVFHRLREIAGGWQGFTPTHGLGISVRSQIATRYPWWSIDSSSWIAPAMYGKSVSRAGRVGANDTRTTNRDVRSLYLIRTLEGWLRREIALTELWAARGLTFTD